MSLPLTSINSVLTPTTDRTVWLCARVDRLYCDHSDEGAAALTAVTTTGVVTADKLTPSTCGY